MKTLSRILIILIAALVVIGAAYAISQTAATQTLIGNATETGQMEDRPAPSDLANSQSTAPDEVSGRPPGGPEGGGGQIETVGRNLLIIAGMIAAVQLLWSIGRRWKLATASLMRKDRLNPGRNS